MALTQQTHFSIYRTALIFRGSLISRISRILNVRELILTKILTATAWYRPARVREIISTEFKKQEFAKN